MSDSDTDSDCLSSITRNNVLGFPNESTIVRARGPGIDSKQIRNFDTFMERQHLTDLQPHHVQSSFRGFALSSMVSGRAPSSTHSICSNVSKADTIVAELKSGRFHKSELYSINEAIKKLLKGRKRRGMEWRRERKLKERRRRRHSGYDSRESGSDSPVSNDDCLSIRTGITALNGHSHSIYTKSRCGRSSDDARSIQTDMNDAPRAIENKIMPRNHVKQDAFKNILSIGPRNVKNTSVNGIQKKKHLVVHKNRFQNGLPLPSVRFGPSKSVFPIPEECNENHLFQVKTKPVTQNINQTDRFQNGLPLPSLRFGPSKSVFPIPEECNENHLFQVKTKPVSQSINETDSERHDSILSEATDPDNSILKHPGAQRKRNLSSSDEFICSKNKKSKRSVPESIIEEVSMAPNATSNNLAKSNRDFVFAKPQLPVPKLLSTKKSEVVKEIEKEVHVDVPKKQSLTVSKLISPIKKPTQEQMSLDEHSQTMHALSSEPSMRPSFMKRKLYTQTLDVTENKKSAESSPSVSPSKGYGELPKEKNKARKLVTSQSCLSREIPIDDNNLLDLIHKIVPPDRMNVTTNATHKIEIRPQGTNTSPKKIVSVPRDEDKDSDTWDVTSILTTCIDDYHSDTFTDEEIFHVNEKKQTNKKADKKASHNKCTVGTTQCRKSPAKEYDKVTKKVMEIENNTKEKPKTAYNYAHAFWNCDTESEDQDTPKQKKLDKECSSTTLTKQNPDANKSKNSLVIKSIKSILDAKSRDDGYPLLDSYNCSIDDIGNKIEAITSNRSLRIRAAKALKDTSMNTPTRCRRQDLQGNMYDTIKRGKLTRNQSRSSMRNSHCKKQVNTKEVNTKSRRKAQEKMNKTPRPKTKMSPVKHINTTICTRSKLKLSKPILSLTCLDQDESESPHLKFTRRGRPIRLNNVTNQAALHPSLQDKGISPNTRGRPRNAANLLNITNKPTETKCTKNKTAKLSPKLPSLTKTTRSRVLETPKGPNFEPSPNLRTVKKQMATKKNNAKSENNKISPEERQQDTNKTDREHKKVPQTAPKGTIRPKNGKQVTTVAVSITRLGNSNIEDYFRRTRSSKEKSFISPVKAQSPPKTKKNGVTQGKSQGRANPPKTKCSPKTQDTVTSDKENADNSSTYRKSRRIRKNTTIYQCCDGETPAGDKSRYFLRPLEPLRKNVRAEKLVEVPDSPSESMTSFRSIREHARSTRCDSDKVPAYKWDLGIAKATIGVVPWHCVPEEPCKTLIDDDNKSVTVRSIASTSILSRGGRPKFLHVW